jgi:hypothetical protein
LPGQDFDLGAVDAPPKRKKLDVMERRVAELQMDLNKEVKAHHTHDAPHMCDDDLNAPLIVCSQLESLMEIAHANKPW